MLWFREIAGWLLVVGALYILRTAFILVTNLETPRVIEAAVLVVAGLGVLKGGLALVRIATAARIVKQASN